MKTIDLIRTIRWLETLVGPVTAEYLFSHKLFGSSAQEKVGLAVLLQISSEIALAQQAIINHPLALKILESFHVEKLFDSKYIIETLSTMAKGDEKRGGIPGELWEMLRRWSGVKDCARPLEELTVPPEVSEEKNFDEVLTIEIMRSEKTNTTLETLGKVLDDIEKLYLGFVLLQKGDSNEPLKIIYIASGSSLRVDLKGLGEPIKHIKNLLVEGWSLWRHRKSTELTENSRALLTSLKTFSEIDKQVKSGQCASQTGRRSKPECKSRCLVCLVKVRCPGKFQQWKVYLISP